ncbi:Xylose isomerase-like TIM barrel [Aspergillus sclerotialis]|uniref:Xylose isomerase-like TIM barrel n=1 Tax=Aspergillus sclerotialis TaxID=2070753 RepID=A0A3A2ZP87_9EURO|nr:Xylose isomerase-like TIM barrel [Aspergillus sclerotialis]
MVSNKLAIGSLSLGQHPSHSLDLKISTAAQYGYEGIEVVFSDLEAYSKSQKLTMLDGAERIKEICDQAGIKAISLAAFENFEGYNSALKERLQVANQWIEIARRLQAPYLQVPSQYSKDSTSDQKVIISELQRLADLASSKQPVVSIAYEALSWGVNCSTWESSLEVVEAVNRPNFGLCLDTFHVVTKLWADPFAKSGMYPNADKDLHDTLEHFVKECPLGRIFYVQLSDGERFDPPFSKSHPWYLEGEAPQFTWSKYARPFPYETDLGGYMPVSEIARAWIVEKGFKGWVSLETFDRRMRDKDFKVETAAKRGLESWRKVKGKICPRESKI